MQTFLSNINKRLTKNIKDALEEFKTVKSNVKSEALKDIVEELGIALFGIMIDDVDRRYGGDDNGDDDNGDDDKGDDDKGDDDKGDNKYDYEESIRERE